MKKCFILLPQRKTSLNFNKTYEFFSKKKHQHFFVTNWVHWKNQFRILMTKCIINLDPVTKMKARQTKCLPKIHFEQYSKDCLHRRKIFSLPQRRKSQQSVTKCQAYALSICPDNYNYNQTLWPTIFFLFFSTESP